MFSTRWFRCAALAVSLCLIGMVVPMGALAAEGNGPKPPEGQWYAGDLHVHTTYSHDSWSGPDDDNTGLDEFYTWGWSVQDQADIAASRGLDYLAITDHNDVRSTQDPAYGSDGLIWVPAYENSLRGHAQMLGTDEVLDQGDQSLAAIQALARDLRQRGGAFQINHPSDMKWLESYGHDFTPDTVEVWNIGPWFFQHPLPSSNDNEFSLHFYDEFLDAGARVAATGGSDNHWRTVTPAGGVGQPTTWVFAEEPTTEGILEGLKQGRTVISHQPPAYGSPMAILEADRNGDGNYDALIGDRLPPGSHVRVTVTGAANSTLRLVTNGSTTLDEVAVDSDDFTYELDAPDSSTWIRAEVFMEDAAEARAMLAPACAVIDALAGLFGEPPTTYCSNRQVMLTLTSPLYFGGYDDPDPQAESEDPTP